MEPFDFELYEQMDSEYTGAYYVEFYQVTLPIRIYNHIKDMQFKDGITFYNYIEEVLDKHTSFSLFPGDICFFYPSIHLQKSSSSITFL